MREGFEKKSPFLMLFPPFSSFSFFLLFFFLLLDGKYGRFWGSNEGDYT